MKKNVYIYILQFRLCGGKKTNRLEGALTLPQPPKQREDSAKNPSSRLLVAPSARLLSSHPFTKSKFLSDLNSKLKGTICAKTLGGSN